MYYKQTYKTSCLLDAVCQICKINPKTTARTLIKEYNKESIFHKGGYFKFMPSLKLLRQYNKTPYIKYSYTDDNKLVSNDNTEMILGVNLYPDDGIHPLHALYYDGRRIWDGHSGKFIEKELNQLKIVYSIVCYDRYLTTFKHINYSKYLPEPMAWDWDNIKPSDKITGQRLYLKIL